MATSLTMAPITLNLGWTFAKTENWGSSTSQSGSYTFTDTLSDGTAADQANRLYLASGTISASGTLSLDLAASLTDVFGATITFARVKGIYFQLTTDTAATDVTIGGDAAAVSSLWDAADNGIIVRNGGVFFLYAPDSTAYAVTATTADILLITNNDSGAVATYRLAIFGASA